VLLPALVTFAAVAAPYFFERTVPLFSGDDMLDDVTYPTLPRFDPIFYPWVEFVAFEPRFFANFD
jgi:hypothetical protein